MQPLAFQWREALRAHAPPEWGPATMAVLLIINSYMNNQTGIAWPTRETIAKGAHVAPETVSRAVRAAEQAGWLRVRRGSRNDYEAVIPHHASSSARAPRSRRGDAQSPWGVTSGHTNSEFNSNRTKNSKFLRVGVISDAIVEEAETMANPALTSREAARLLELIDEAERIRIADMAEKRPAELSPLTILALPVEQERV